MLAVVSQYPGGRVVSKHSALHGTGFGIGIGNLPCFGFGIGFGFGFTFGIGFISVGSGFGRLVPPCIGLALVLSPSRSFCLLLLFGGVRFSRKMMMGIDD